MPMASKHAEAQRRYRERHPEKAKASVDKWVAANRPAVRAMKVKWETVHREKHLAHRAVMRAVHRGRVVRPASCSRCGSVCAPHAHHHDYTKRLDVVWLCRQCHAAAHKEG